MTDKDCKHNDIMIDCVIGGDQRENKTRTLDWAMCESCGEQLKIKIKLLSVGLDKDDD